jgi:hypothetical protein
MIRQPSRRLSGQLLGCHSLSDSLRVKRCTTVVRLTAQPAHALGLAGTNLLQGRATIGNRNQFLSTADTDVAKPLDVALPSHVIRLRRLQLFQILPGADIELLGLACVMRSFVEGIIALFDQDFDRLGNGYRARRRCGFRLAGRDFCVGHIGPLDFGGPPIIASC